MWYSTGLTDDENGANLSEIIMRRLAELLPPTQIIRLTASLFGNVGEDVRIQIDFPDLESADHFLLLMVEWQRRKVNKGMNTTAAAIVSVLQDAEIDCHLVCQVGTLIL